MSTSRQMERVNAMLSRMQHRGPDDQGVWRNENAAFGHRRLSIVDLSPKGHQPMETDDGRLVAVVNGEIYNYASLRKELEAHGLTFQSDSDSEVILHAYRAWGVASFARLNGMFAFGLWDRNEQCIYVVRDRIGIKPVYYLHERGTFCFASEIKALVAGFPDRRWTIDRHGLVQYLTFENLLGSQSLLTGVSLLRPGHYLKATSSSIREFRYWEPPEDLGRRCISFSDAVDKFQSTFSSAVERHLMSDVPVASYLSSGLDSSMVATLATRIMERPTAAFTGHFALDGWYDERAGARLVAERIGATLAEVEIGPKDMERAFDKLIFALDEPRMGVGALPQYLVAEKAAESHKVILTGHGGDELFSGYPVFKAALMANRLYQADLRIFGDLIRTRPTEVPHLAYFGLLSFRSAQVTPTLPVLFSLRRQTEALLPDVAQMVTGTHSMEPLSSIVEGAGNLYEKILLTYLQVYLPGLLVVEDKISMAHSLESRTPWLDNEMIDLALSLPADIKLKGGRLKAIVREAARGVLPDQLLSMPKRGFPTPLGQWLRGPLSDWMRARLTSNESALMRLFRADYLENETTRYLNSPWQRFRPLDEIATHRIWMLLSLESWLRQYQDQFGITLDVG